VVSLISSALTWPQHCVKLLKSKVGIAADILRYQRVNHQMRIDEAANAIGARYSGTSRLLLLG